MLDQSLQLKIMHAVGKRKRMINFVQYQISMYKIIALWRLRVLRLHQCSQYIYPFTL